MVSEETTLCMTLGNEDEIVKDGVEYEQSQYNVAT